jgi:hypothetical protein
MKLALILQFILLCALSGLASAEILDDITLKTGANGEIEATIKFSVPIHYTRYFPLRKSADLAIYFNVLGSVPRDEWQNYLVHRSPPSDIVGGFTVTTRDLNTGPKIEVQFLHPVEFSVSAGRDDRSILLRIRPPAAQEKKEEKPAGPAAGGVTLPAVPMVGAAPAVITPPLAVPASKIAAVPKAVPATPVVTQPAVAPVQTAATATPAQAPGTSQPKPASALSPAPAQPAPPQLGGADGLPPFPRIEKASPESVSAKPAETLSLAEQIKKADNQAALLMAKGRDAMLTGVMFSAIDTFNSVLKLPPNKYSPAAQVWIGIAREKSGQQAKAKLEYELYLKLYPDGTDAAWVRGRLAALNSIQAAAPIAASRAVPVLAHATEFQTTTYGSISMYYYHGASQTDTVATIGGVQTPSTLSLTDQSSLISNVSMTARSYNNEFDNRFVFQDFNSKSFLKGQTNQNRLNAAYYDVRNRVDNYSARIGRQSAMGGGVLGRFDGVSAGYGFLQNWRANVAAGQLSDKTLDSKPTFLSLGLDFGVNSPLGGSVYLINQRAGGLTDRKAAGGNLRYFEQGKTALAMLDYDIQFKALNILTLQGTLNYDSGTDYNFLFDRRRSPVLDIRNAVSGTTSTISTLLLNGWTTSDLLTLANSRTAISNLAMVGVTQRFQEKWQAGTDFIVSNTSGLQASGTLNPDGTTGLEGFVAATPSTGNAWTINGRLSGSDVISARDMSMCSLSYSKSRLTTGETLLLYNHSYPRELWTLDTTLRLFWQTDSTGGKVNTTAPVVRVGYRLRSSLTLEGEGGVDWTKSTPAALPPSNTTRKYFSVGFRWDI